jgi:hypothetical protein
LLVVAPRCRLPRPGLVSSSLWAAMLLLAGALAVGIGPIYDSFGTSTDGRVAADLTKLALVVSAAAGLHVHDNAISGKSRRRVLAGVVAAVAVVLTMIVPLAVSPPARLDPILAQLGDTTFFDSTWRCLVVWLPVLAYFTWIVTDGAIFSWCNGRDADRGPTRNALRLGLVGFCTAEIYVLMKLYVIGVWMLGRPTEGLLRLDAAVENLVIVVVVVALALASSWVAISARWQRLMWSVWSRLQTRQLYDLWAALLEDHPDLVLPIDRSHRLRRMVVEIRDGLLALSEVTEQDSLEEARQRAASMGSPDPDATALALLVAVHGRDNPRAIHPASLPIGTSGDLPAEVGWLRGVAHEYHRLRNTSRSQHPLLSMRRSSS